MLKQLQLLILLLFLAGFIPNKAFAQFPYNESFTNSTAPGMNLGGTAVLTSGNGSDAVGNGYLRLTTATGSQAGYAYSSSSFPSSKGISVSFEYYTYGGTGADGICFFLYDANTPTFNVGSYGGGLGYTNVTSSGLSRGYLGIGLDEYGNFSDPGAGGNGGPGRVTNSVTIRGAYNDSNGAYAYLTTVPVQTNYGFPIGSSGSTRPTTGGSGYRKAYIDITPHVGSGYDITVKIQHDAVSTPVTVISNYYYNKAAPANLKFGYAASTGGSTNYHEIRNVGVTLPAGASVVAPTQTNQTLNSCANGTGSVNISSGFSTTNSPNGAINTASVDLDPSTSGIQTTYTVTNKGTFTSDDNGNITFTPLNNTVIGTAGCNFTVADNYGATSNTATVTATINAAPNLVITNPTAVCSPSTVNLTAAAVTSGSDASLTLTYYTNSAATIALNNPNTVASSGTYYIKAVNANGCSVIQPVTVTINPQPTTANAGVNQNITATAPTSVTLNGNVATVGTGSWSQVSGPTTATFANPALRNTSVSNLNPGSYVFRWTITNSCGSSPDDVTVTITGTQAITFASFPAKTYGAADFNASATASSGLAVTYTSSNPAVATVDATGSVHILAAGTTNITASQTGNINYAAATAIPKTLTVNKAPLTITADSQNKPYGVANPALTVSYTGFVNGDTNTSLTVQPIVSTTATAASTVGSYPVTVSGATAANYNITYVSGSLAVFPGAQTITFTAQPKAYGDPDFTLSATASSGLPINYTSSNPAIATVDAQGVVHIVSAGMVTITASQAGNGNYVATTNINQQLVINKAALTITADNQSKAYGSANPAFTLSYSGFTNGDTNTSLTTQATVSTAVTAYSAVGTYPIAVAGATSADYTITYQAGTLTVGTSAQTIAFAPLPAKTYGDADFTLSATSSSGLPITYISSDPTVATVSASGLVHIIAAGPVTFTASQAGDSNYDAATPTQQTFTISPATLTITANNSTNTYGSANAALTVTYNGFINGDTQSNLTAQPTVTTTATAASVAGTYPITVSGAASPNYAITYTNGSLTVVKAVLTITADNQTKGYGLANPALSVTYGGFVNGDTQASLTARPTITTNATATSAVGTYPITVNGAASPNYTFNYSSGTLTVTNATVSGVSLAQVALFENRPSGTLAGTLAAASLDPNATYTYSLVNGSSSTDNASFSIQGNKLVTAISLNYEQKASYTITVRATNQFGLYLDQTFNINLNDVNEAPTLAAIANQSVCNIASTQTINLTGITAGPETAQTTAITVSSNNAALFNFLYVSSVTNSSATITYQLATTGTATVNVTVKDNGGTANGGTDSFSQTFTLTANEVPVAAISSDKGLQVSKGETITLTASGGSTYSWGAMPNVSGTTSSAVIKVRPAQTTTYQVTVTNASGCSSTSNITIEAKDNYALIQPSNILTPNGDGKNDTWVVKNLDLYPNNTVSIFDKAGRLLNKVSRYNNDWDGSLNGSPLAEGTYYYVIDFGPSKGLIKGFITILRNR